MFALGALDAQTPAESVERPRVRGGEGGRAGEAPTRQRPTAPGEGRDLATGRGPPHTGSRRRRGSAGSLSA
ncbi:ABC transporter permease [Leifsonia xyli subsp. cynodontis DSM 46306]|uniref:Uncharacterized protein n=1 Tax=Leifsonia xyli subsp. cynodontis DSM 46306 TaxID=1389489 RepID=U3P486_LEIXC|nr:ABC transporter permease [Leifsonia xyli subsp. cynodontis DSM 46306]